MTHEPRRMPHRVRRRARRPVIDDEPANQSAIAGSEDLPDDERDEHDEELASEVGALIASPPQVIEEASDPELLERLVEGEWPPAEVVALHEEDELAAALLDEGPPLDSDASASDAIEVELDERRATRQDES